MSLRELNGMLLLALLASLGVHTAISRRDPGQPNADFVPDMAEPIAYGAFDPNPNFPDGKTLREPIPGTIARGHLPLHYRATPEDALRAGEQLHNPFAHGDSKWRQRGELLFANYCQICHGPRGLGDGSVPKKGFPAPPSLLSDHTRSMKDGQLFHILTYGQGNMASYAGQLSPEDRWSVLLHVRSLQEQTPPSPEKRP